jgi:hypothetical protein
MNLKKAYLYLVSVISLIIAVIASIMLLNMALKTWVFPKADKDFFAGPCYSSKPAVVNGEAVRCTLEEEAMQKKQNDENRSAQKQRDASQALAMILVSAPIWFFHWKFARKEV